MVGACSSEPDAGPMYDYGIEIAARNPDYCANIATVIRAQGLDETVDQIEMAFSDAYRTSIPDPEMLSLATGHFSNGVLDGCDLPEDVAATTPSPPPTSSSERPISDGSEFEFDDWRTDEIEDQRWSDYLRDGDR